MALEHILEESGEEAEEREMSEIKKTLDLISEYIRQDFFSEKLDNLVKLQILNLETLAKKSLTYGMSGEYLQAISSSIITIVSLWGSESCRPLFELVRSKKCNIDDLILMNDKSRIYRSFTLAADRKIYELIENGLFKIETFVSRINDPKAVEVAIELSNDEEIFNLNKDGKFSIAHFCMGIHAQSPSIDCSRLKKLLFDDNFQKLVDDGRVEYGFLAGSNSQTNSENQNSKANCADSYTKALIEFCHDDSKINLLLEEARIAVISGKRLLLQDVRKNYEEQAGSQTNTQSNPSSSAVVETTTSEIPMEQLTQNALQRIQARIAAVTELGGAGEQPGSSPQTDRDSETTTLGAMAGRDQRMVRLDQQIRPRPQSIL